MLCATLFNLVWKMGDLPRTDEQVRGPLLKNLSEIFAAADQAGTGVLTVMEFENMIHTTLQMKVNNGESKRTQLCQRFYFDS